MKDSSSHIPHSAWNRWNSPKYSDLRRFVYIFGSNTKKEIPVQMQDNVMYLIQEGEATKLIEGIFYITTKRFVFIPKDSAAINSFVTATYQSIYKLVGTRYDLSMSITNFEMGIANFQFQSQNILFQVFNLLKLLSETVRYDKEEFKTEIISILKKEELEQNPFSCIECEFEETENEWEIQEDNEHINLSLYKSESEDNFIFSPIKSFINLFVYMHFDIHIKLRILFFISLITFCLKFIPFLSMIFLLISCALLFTAWKKLNENNDNSSKQVKLGENNDLFNDDNLFKIFIKNWFFWQDYQKSSKLLKISLFMFSAWALLDEKLYFVVCILFIIFFILKKIFKSNLRKQITIGYWLSS